MGAVYVAEQLSKLRALKVLNPDLVADPYSREQFSLEARIGGQIGSGHVVEVIAAGVDEETEIPYLAMELLEGEDLADLLHRRAGSRRTKPWRSSSSSTPWRPRTAPG